MADYRKRLVDMTDEERAEVAPGAPQFSDDYENVPDPLSVQMMEAGLDFTPVGIIKGVSDIKDELSKDDPNYLKALGMTAVEAAGIIPGAAPVLKGMVKGSFKTSKGSVYDVFDDSTTVRNRAERGDSESVGIQPRSGKTIYMTREGVDELGPLFQNTEIPVQFVPVEGGKAKLVHTQDYGPKKAGMDASPEVPYTLDPEVGLHPVEILDSRNTNRRNIHFGNDITVVESNVPSTKASNKQVSNTEYAEGGAVMDEQMEMAFGDAGERVDPVSGNEVPTGSLPEEVRDDIPAQLSEGEYVVPADVVRFFGVKFFEDIRAEAKRGFASMEANGRIGGEPIGIEMGGDELPFDISELQMVDDGEPEQPMMNEGGFISGYAPGGLADTGDLPLTEENYQGTGMQQRQYTNAEGNIITILFFNGMPMSVIPAGYSPYTPEATPTEAKEAVVNDNDDGPPPMQNPEPIDYKALSAEELRGLVEDQKGTNSTAISLGLGMLNPLLGMAFKAASWHQSKQITKELQRRMEDGSLDAKQKAFYTDLTETMTADQPGFFERLFGKTEEEAKKPDVAGTVMTPEEITATVEAALAYSPEEGYVPTGMPPIPAPSPITMKVLDDEPGARDYKGPLAPTVSSDTDSGSDASGSTDIFADAASNADAGTAEVVAAAEENLATESEISDIQKEGDKIKEKLESAARGGGRGFSDGGLMKKKK